MTVHRQPRYTTESYTIRSDELLFLDYGNGAPEVRIVCNHDATVAHVKFEIFGELYESTGSAELHPKDSYEREIGIALATARAMRAMARILEEATDNRTDLNDLMRQSLDL